MDYYRTFIYNYEGCFHLEVGGFSCSSTKCFDFFAGHFCLFNSICSSVPREIKSVLFHACQSVIVPNRGWTLEVN